NLCAHRTPPFFSDTVRNFAPAFSNLSASARSISRCISSAPIVSLLAALKSTFSRIDRRAMFGDDDLLGMTRASCCFEQYIARPPANGFGTCQGVKLGILCFCHFRTDGSRAKSGHRTLSRADSNREAAHPQT